MAHPSLSRRDLFLGATAATITLGVSRTAGAAPDVRPFEYDDVSVAELAERLKAGSLYSRVLTAKYLERINDIDRKGPELASVIEVNPDAAAIAEALDRERRDKGPRGPLHGIPVLIKDNIDTKDKMQTTAGSLALDRLEAGRRTRRRPQAARGRGGHPRQDEPERVGQLPRLQLDQRLERPRGADEEPLRPRPQSFWLQLRFRRGRRREPVRCRNRNGDGWVDRQPVVGLRYRRAQADGRPRQPRRDHPDLRTRRTRPARWDEPSATSRSCWA